MSLCIGCMHNRIWISEIFLLLSLQFYKQIIDNFGQGKFVIADI